ncbi:Sodium/calcium exchanger protein-domain-containing protein [Dipodascopsis uninucleata]
MSDIKKSPHELFSFNVADDGVDRKAVKHATNQCAFVRTYCQDDDLGFFNYLEIYYCTLEDLRPFVFFMIAVWMIAVFTTLGIVASDFLCPNLSAISELLGLSESLAGVTILALGNGSPDVVSTYAAMKIGSGSLAIGELIGSASFITSVVGGTMAIIRPFTVQADSFIRDVGFFTISIAFSIYCLQDGKIYTWECIGMISVYVVYVIFIATWHYHEIRETFEDVENAVLTSATSLSGHVRSRSILSDVINDSGNDRNTRVDVPTENDSSEESVPLLGPTVSRQSMGIDIQEAVDRYKLRAIQEGRFNDISQIMKIQRRGNNHNFRSCRHQPTNDDYDTASPRMASSAPIRPSLFGALELRAAAQRGRRLSDDSNKEAMYRTHSRASSQATEYNHIYVPTTGNDFYGKKKRNRRENSRQGSRTRRSDIETEPVFNFQHRSLNKHNSTIDSNSDWTRSADYIGDWIYNSGSSRSQHSSSRTSQKSAHTECVTTAARSSLEQRINTNSSDENTRPDNELALGERSGRSSSRNLGRPSPNSRSPSPFDRFLAFNPDAGPTFQDHNSGIEDDELVSDNDGNISPTTAATLSPQRLESSSGSHHRRTLSYGSFSESEFGMSSTSSDIAFPFCTWCYFPRPHNVRKTLFPTLSRLSEKSAINKIISVLVAPSVLLLTLTIPVIEREHSGGIAGCGLDTCRIPELQIDNGEGNISRQIRDDDSSIYSTVSRYKGWNKWLFCLQCVCSPLAIAFINMYNNSNIISLILYCLLGGLVLQLIVILSTDSRRQPRKLLPFLMICGFLVSISWISAIAVEAVAILKAYGVMFGIGDAILGLTVFALGNSLGDFISNATIAGMGYPMMALSACFGSPMLNILLGIGGSGLLTIPYVSKPGHEMAYYLDIEPSLVITTISLFINLIFYLIVVPLNGWRMNRLIGFTSVSLWICSTAINVILEIRQERRQ